MDGTDVLVVDDERQVREFLSRALSQRGFVCRTARGSDQAVAEVSDRTPDLVITDLQMPERDGRWLLEKLKRRWPELPVIMLTGDEDARTAVQCLKDGAHDYLVKPIDLDELWIAARRAVEKVRLVNETRSQRAQLEIVETQSERLREAFGIIETTYRDALNSLLRAESLEASGAIYFTDDHHEGETESHRSELSHRKSVTDRETGKAIELSALRVAGRLIGDGAPFVDVGTAIAKELVEHDGLTCVRIWIHSEDEDDLKPLVAVGNGSVPGRDEADRTLLSAKMERVDSNDVTSLSCPILVRGVARAVVQLVAPTQMGANMVQSAERLSLVLAASLAREQETRERRRAVEELDLLYELSSASRYSLDLEHVAEFLLESLDKFVDYDVASLLLVDENPSLNIQTRFPSDDDFTRRVRAHVLANLKLTCGIEPPRDLAVQVRSVDSAPLRPAPSKLRSFINVPLTVGGSVAGLLYLGSGRDRSFTNGEIQFVHRAANFLATSVQGVRELVATVKSRIEQMVDHMTDGVLMLDRRGSVVVMNRAAREALNCLEAAEQPTNASKLAKLLDFNPFELLKLQQRSLRRLVCVRGVPYQAQLSPVVSENGDMVGAVLAFRNFQQEQKLDEMKTELVNVVSHELRTPLTAIKNALALLNGTRLGALSAQQLHFVSLAQRNVEQLVGIINDLLDLSKLEAGKMQIDLEPLSLAEPIASASISLEAQAEAKGISLQTFIDNDLPRVYGDVASIQRVLINLIGNAIKFTESGGRVSVEAVRVEGESGCVSGSAVRVTVSDSGVGVPQDQLESIFDKFHQVAGGNRHTTTVGTGLGLPICRELVKAHYGRIWAESDERSGSRFSFTLPLLNDYELLMRCLHNDITRARQQGVSIVVALLTARYDRGALAEQGSDSVQLLGLLKDAAKRVTQRLSGRVFQICNESQVVLSLPHRPGEGGRLFGERIAEELQKADIPKDGFSVRVGWSTFPDDGESAESLYSRAEADLEESESVLA